MKNRKKIGYKDHLENYIEPLETESNYIFWFKVHQNYLTILHHNSSSLEHLSYVHF
jgi:hypothetical protein